MEAWPRRAHRLRRMRARAGPGLGAVPDRPTLEEGHRFVTDPYKAQGVRLQLSEHGRKQLAAAERGVADAEKKLLEARRYAAMVRELGQGACAREMGLTSQAISDRIRTIERRQRWRRWRRTETRKRLGSGPPTSYPIHPLLLIPIKPFLTRGISLFAGQMVCPAIPYKEEVGGSSPSAPTAKMPAKIGRHHAHRRRGFRPQHDLERRTVGGHDTSMGAFLSASGGLTVAHTRAATQTLKILTLVGAAATLVVGFLLFFHLA